MSFINDKMLDLYQLFEKSANNLVMKFSVSKNVAFGWRTIFSCLLHKSISFWKKHLNFALQASCRWCASRGGGAGCFSLFYLSSLIFRVWGTNKPGIPCKWQDIGFKTWPFLWVAFPIPRKCTQGPSSARNWYTIKNQWLNSDKWNKQTSLKRLTYKGVLKRNKLFASNLDYFF